ncbi:MAG TPA: hypothetical protein VGO49_10325 [Bradyrhizobium sp.]|jgi:hypothetical protein|nr:hypothetical protein [Bradyrhizobium sp.]
MKQMKDLSLRELSDLFQEATEAAAMEARKHGLPQVGLDGHGELHEPPKPEDAPDVSSGNTVA